VTRALSSNGDCLSAFEHGKKCEEQVGPNVLKIFDVTVTVVSSHSHNLGEGRTV
jgi:hypothetical protein